MTQTDRSSSHESFLSSHSHPPNSGHSHDSSHSHSSHSHGSHSHGSHSHSHHSHGHIHSEESTRRLVNRLSRIEGHIRGIKTMLQENRSCPDVLVQIAAVRGALDRVGRIILDEHLTECIARAAKEGDIEAEIDELKAALDRFLI
ncbi:metal-sensing transcriptional repressor [Alkalinema sp. FACHB-956]|uniref:metal-sensing transcriptional repressor n=1 Tax=Alkalinema sp. FACHB-956 TaxID=2692768 RepID=UPI001689CE53|nr:metal-sensing transcriptional repressor [Alkalinema sp. FACHB-956]MBD2325590.1 metal-sensing transcriptional repressor [Alkalinema sp. FACHB-956]